MSKTKIEWCDYAINPVKGLCPMACPYCYARRMYKRFKWNPEVRFDGWVYEIGPHIPAGSKIFVGSTMELFGDWVKPEWLEYIFEYCESAPKHTHIFLTKQPQNLRKWSPFPDNCWVGASVTDLNTFMSAMADLKDIKAKVRFLSFEPLLDWHCIETISVPSLEYLLVKGYDGGAKHYTLSSFMKLALDWIIIGQQTPVSAKTTPMVEWIEDIVSAADKAGIPVFLKNNLEDLLPREGFIVPTNSLFWNRGTRRLRQEFPCK